MASEITENEDEEGLCIIKTEAQKDKVRQIIEYQKSLYLSSCTSSSYYSTAAVAVSSSAPSSYYSTAAAGSSCTRNSLLDFTKEGSTSLRRLFNMEMATHMEDYSGSPTIKPIENVICSHSPRRLASVGSFKESAYQNRKQKIGRLSRTKSFTRWRCRGFRFRMRLRRVRILLCGGIFKTNMI